MIELVTFYPNYIHSSGFDKTVEPSIVGNNYACSGGETTGGVYDLVDSKRTTQLTIDTNGETADCQIDLDLSSQLTGGTFLLLDNHNLATASTNIKTRFGSSNTDISMTGVYSGTLESEMTADYSGGGSTGPIVISHDGCLLVQFGSSSSSYWNLLIGTGTYAADVQAGELFIGKSFSPSTSPETIDDIYNYEGIQIAKTFGGQKISKKYYGSRKRWSLKWSYITESEKESFEAVFNATEGGRFPFYVDFGEESNPKLYFVRLIDNSLKIRKLTSQAYEIGFTLESEV